MRKIFINKTIFVIDQFLGCTYFTVFTISNLLLFYVFLKLILQITCADLITSGRIAHSLCSTPIVPGDSGLTRAHLASFINPRK